MNRRHSGRRHRRGSLIALLLFALPGCGDDGPTVVKTAGDGMAELRIDLRSPPELAEIGEAWAELRPTGEDVTATTARFAPVAGDEGRWTGLLRTEPGRVDIEVRAWDRAVPLPEGDEPHFDHPALGGAVELARATAWNIRAVDAHHQLALTLVSAESPDEAASAGPTILALAASTDDVSPADTIRLDAMVWYAVDTTRPISDLSGAWNQNCDPVGGFFPDGTAITADSFEIIEDNLPDTLAGRLFRLQARWRAPASSADCSLSLYVGGPGRADTLDLRIPVQP